MNTITKDINEKSEDEEKHVDEFISFGTSLVDRPENEDYARWVLNHFRLSAMCKNAFDEFMRDSKLFCEYKDKKYRVTGASRLGDIWLNDDFARSHGYTERVGVMSCSNWSSK